MKEAHTLMEARHFLEDGNYFTNRYDYQSRPDNPEGIHSDNFPLFTWLIAFVWMFTGESVLAARVLALLFSMSTIFFTYLIAKRLFDREDIALISAFLLAVLPVFVYFSRLVFFDVPALAFSVAAIYFFLRWKERPVAKDMVLFVVLFSLAALSKVVYLVLLFPVAAIFPYERFRNIKKYGYHMLALLAVPAVVFIYSLLDKNKFSSGVLKRALDPAHIEKVLSYSFWHNIYLFAVSDNFTKIGFGLMLLGFTISVFYMRKSENRFIVVWALSIVPYAVLIGWMLEGHNYYQFPFLPAGVMLMAYGLVYIFTSLMPKRREANEVLTRIAIIPVAMLLLYLVSVFVNLFPCTNCGVQRAVWIIVMLLFSGYVWKIYSKRSVQFRAVMIFFGLVSVHLSYLILSSIGKPDILFFGKKMIVRNLLLDVYSVIFAAVFLLSVSALFGKWSDRISGYLSALLVIFLGIPAMSWLFIQIYSIFSVDGVFMNFIYALGIIILIATAPLFIIGRQARSVIIVAVFFLFFIVFMSNPFQQSRIAQYNVQFMGLETAGQYMREHSDPADRVFGSGHQDTGFYWYAARQGSELKNNLSYIKELESDLNYRWIYLYYWKLPEIAKPGSPVWTYIQDNYSPRHIAVDMATNSMLYILLEKGGSFNETTLMDSFAHSRGEEKQYEFIDPKSHDKVKKTIITLDSS